MRTGKMSMDEALKAEKAVADRQAHRSSGYRLMKDRDAARAVLSNGVVMEWHIPKPPASTPSPGKEIIATALPDGGVEFKRADGTEVSPLEIKSIPRGCDIPEDLFALNGVLYDTEEFRKYLRWC